MVGRRGDEGMSGTPARQPQWTAPLPSGRHYLSREQVVASQRARMLLAMAEAMLEKGYVGTPVAEIIRRAGVSRETFYQQFRSKQDCFIQALDAAMDILTQELGKAGQEAADGVSEVPEDRFRALLHVYLRTLADAPAFARVFLVEVYAAGPAAMERRTRFQRRIADVIAEIFQATSPDHRFGCDALVAATAQMVTACLIADDLDGLRNLEDPLVGLARKLLN
jgi:AcrR family transcriptional regulator